MAHTDDLAALWHASEIAPLRGAPQVAAAARAHRNEALRKKALAILAALIAGVVELWTLRGGASPTTKAGAVFAIIACIVLGSTNLWSMGRFMRRSDSMNAEFIAFMEITLRNRLWYHKWTQPLGLALCSMSLLLVAFDITKAGVWTAVAVYALLVVLLGVVWLYVRPRLFKKQHKKLLAQINEWKQISLQYEK